MKERRNNFLLCQLLLMMSSGPASLQCHAIKAVRYEGFGNFHDLVEDLVRLHPVVLLQGLPLIDLISDELVAHA